MRHVIRFLRKGEEVELEDVRPTDTLLDYLRLKERACGTKEGCAEGDCGACTVVLGSVKDGKLHYRPANSCILLMGQVDGADVVAVDDLAADEDRLHPVQEAMVRHHASQCGFCTPGFVMSLFGLYHSGKPATRDSARDWIAGNLCRCTGYRPILDAALEACTGRAADAHAARTPDTAAALARIDRGGDVFIGDDERFLAIPASVASLAELFLRHPDAVLVAGATDVGLWITKQLRDLPKIIFLHRAGLGGIEAGADEIVLGAAVTYEDAFDAVASIDSDLGLLLRRLGSRQVRAAGTVGGNIANGSPIGDMPPALIALDGAIELRKGDATRWLALEDFFIAYGKQDRAPGEFVARIRIPRLKPAERFRCYKVARRFDQDISALMGAFRVAVDGDRIASARIAFGGMAATPKRAIETERALAGASLADRGTWKAVLAALDRDYRPIDDHRASAAYRAAAARALLDKALRELAGESSAQTRLVGLREAAVGRVA